MTHTLKLKIIAFVTAALMLMGIGYMSAPVITAQDQAATNSSKTEACDALKALDPTVVCDNAGDNSAESGIVNVAKVAINILSLVVGIASVIVITISGFRFITSSGDSQQVQGARNGIIYAIVGLVVVILAQTIVAFVLNKL